MAQSQRNIMLRITGDTKHFEEHIKKANVETSKFRKSVEKATTTNKFFANQFQKAATAASTLHGPLNGISGRLNALATTFRIAGVSAVAMGTALGGLTIGLKHGFDAAVQTEHQMARLEGVIQATGGASGFTAEQMDEMARSIAMNTLASTEGVRGAMAALATFSTISGDTFERTINVSQDLAEVMGSDIQGATMQLAKALDAPILGMNSLRRAGVSFTAQQREQIKELEKTGELFKQQEIILGAVEAQLRGVAEAAASNTFVGAMDTLGQSVTEFWEKVVMASGAMEKFKGWINSISESIQRATREFDLQSASIHTLQGEMAVMDTEIMELAASYETANWLMKKGIEKTLEEKLELRRRHHEAIKELQEKEKAAQEAADNAAAQSAQTLAENRAAALAKVQEKIDKIVNRVQGQIEASQTREAGTSDDPMDKANAQYEARLARMERDKALAMEQHEGNLEIERIYNELEIQLMQEHEARKEEIRTEAYEKQQAEQKEARDQRIKELKEEHDARMNMYNAYANAVSSTLGTIAGAMKEGSKAQQVALWAEKAVTIAKVNMNIIDAMSDALTIGYPQNMVAMGQVAALGASLVAQLASISSVGSRASGGAVLPGGRYMVGEHGPEMITMGRVGGQVTKTEDLTPNVNVSIVESAERAGTVQQEGDNIEVYVAAAMSRLTNDLNSGRGLFAAVENRYGLQR